MLERFGDPYISQSVLSMTLKGLILMSEPRGLERTGQKGVNMKSNLINLGLQYFAEGTEDKVDNGGTENPVEPLSFDDSLKANKEYQSEFDRRIGKAIETAKAKWQEEAEALLNQKISEAEKLSKMDAEQKAQYEREEAEKKLAEREAIIIQRELRLSAIDTLNEKGLPIELADCLSYSDADSCNKSIESVAKAFESAVSRAINDRLRGTPPKAGSPKTKPYTNEQLKNMSVDEINAHWEEIKNNV